MSEDLRSLGKLERLIDALIDETISMPDEDILAAPNLGHSEEELRSEITKAISAHRRERLIAAKAAVASAKTIVRERVTRKGDLRSSLAKAVAANDSSFTLAAREGRDISEADLEGIAEDLEELGLTIEPEDDTDPS